MSKDVLGRPLTVGDLVVCERPYVKGLTKAKVLRLSAVGASVVIPRSDKAWDVVFRKSAQICLIRHNIYGDLSHLDSHQLEEHLFITHWEIH